jgi:20S proteasome subunit beta 2
MQHNFKNIIGIIHDLGSGSNVDVCILTKDKTEYLRNIKMY